MKDFGQPKNYYTSGLNPDCSGRRWDWGLGNSTDRKSAYGKLKSKHIKFEFAEINKPTLWDEGPALVSKA